MDRWRATLGRWRDPAAALLLAAAAVADDLADPPSGHRLALLVPLSLAITLPAAVRLRFPLGAALVVMTCFAASSAVDDTDSPRLAHVVALVLILWTLGRHRSGRRLAVGLVWFAAALVVASLTAASGHPTSLEDVLFGAFLFVLPVAAGSAVQLRQAHLELATERAERAEEGRAQALADAADAERDRIARELHDIVMHSISVVAVQTQAIRRRLGPEHRAEIDDLAAVERTAREAMTEMRRLFGVLRAREGPPQLAPQPGLAQLDRLLDDARRAGLHVEAQVELPGRPLTAGVDLTAYRVLQESLTNTLKHAGPEATVRLSVSSTAAEVLLEVCDDGSRRPAVPPVAGGHGLIGMRERVALYGGALEVGRVPGGGFRVAARLPAAEAGIL